MKKNKAGGIIVPDCKVHGNAIIIIIVWYWHTIRHRPMQQNRERPEIKPHMYNIRAFTWETRTLNKER